MQQDSQSELNRDQIEEFLRNFTSSFRGPGMADVEKLLEAVDYSLLGGGKRFRPVLALLTGNMLGLEPRRILPLAAAVEMIHNYSLVHDDLPCMDNDLERRGRPTTHVVYGEANALLVGDALLTESFRCLAQLEPVDQECLRELIPLLCEAAGLEGMIGGQFLDLQAQGAKASKLEQLQRLHEMKTGALIRVCVEGPAVLARLEAPARERLRRFGLLLGLAFQIKDDLLDHVEENPELGSYPALLGLQATREKLEQIHLEARECLESFESRAGSLLSLVEYNEHRQL